MKNILLYFALSLLLIDNEATAQNFAITGVQIIGPDGSPFIIKGADVNGPFWPWSRSTVDDADLIVDAWKFNTIRVNCFPSFKDIFPNNNSDLDKIVNKFTSRKVVVIIEDQDLTGKYPSDAELQSLVTWWQDIATRYKDNTYVWFNISNEPGSDGPAPEIWKTFHETVIKAIRDIAPLNIIVLDGHQFGQEAGYTSPEESAIQTYGEYFVQHYSNICFSIHLYDRWIYGRDHLIQFIEDAHQKNLCVMMGEYGTAMNYSRAVAAQMFSVALDRGIGRVAWQWDGTDGHRFTKDGGGWAITPADGSFPTNLSFAGNLIWKDNHNMLQTGSADFNIPGPWISNGNFENDLNDWISFGNQSVSTTQKHSGAKAFEVNAGNDGGAVQLIYLLPDSTYVLSAWASISGSSPEGTVGVQYKVNGVQQQHALSFSETGFVKKQIEFKTAAGLSDASIFIYRASGSNNFFVDDIQVYLNGESSITSIDKEELSATRVFPNPFSAYIKIVSEKDAHSVSLQSSAGSMVRTWSVISRDALIEHLDELPTGLYFLTVRYRDSSVRTVKIFKQ